jgi:hypothetical protein
MLDTIPCGDLVAIYNTIAKKGCDEVPYRANGVRRTEALLEARGLTLPEAARLADVVLAHGNAIEEKVRSATPSLMSGPPVTMPIRANPSSTPATNAARWG